MFIFTCSWKHQTDNRAVSNFDPKSHPFHVLCLCCLLPLGLLPLFLLGPASCPLAFCPCFGPVALWLLALLGLWPFCPFVLSALFAAALWSSVLWPFGSFVLLRFGLDLSLLEFLVSYLILLLFPAGSCHIDSSCRIRLPEDRRSEVEGWRTKTEVEANFAI